MPRSFALALLVAFSSVALAYAAKDIQTSTGKIEFTVESKSSLQPVANANIHIAESSRTDAQVLATDRLGHATSMSLAPGQWLVIIESDGFSTQSQIIDVVAGKRSPVTIKLLAPAARLLVVKVSRLVAQSAGESGVSHGKAFINKFGNAGGNGQSLGSILKANPGLATDSSGQVHPVGEHSATSIIIDGFQIPGSIPGRQGQPVTPSIMSSIDVMTGNYAPKYGRETAAILDVNLAEGDPKPITDLSQTYGGYQTSETSIITSGELGQSYGLPVGPKLTRKRLAYLFDGDVRSTDNALEAPEPDPQSSHNGQTATYLFGHLSYQLNDRSVLRFTASTNPVETQIANRTGLPAFYVPFGQGYGFGGLQSASFRLASQQQLGQDIYQTDYNEYGVLSYVHQIHHNDQLKVAFGLSHNGLNVLNHNPAIDLAELPSDNSIEYNPTLIRNQRDLEGSTSLTLPRGHHSLEFGFVEDHQTGIDSYQLIPASLAALNDLLSGNPTTPTPDPTNPLYTFRPDGDSPTTIGLTRKGDYRASYAQDTWQMSPKISINYGIRWEQYIQNESFQRNSDLPEQAKVTLSQLEPRFNFDYSFSPKYVFHASYNRLMIVPPTPQGLSFNTSGSNSAVVEPETDNQLEAGTAVTLKKNESLTIAYIYKQLTNQLDTGLLVPGAQIGSYVSASIPADIVRAFEVGYEVSSGKPYGMDGYISYQNATAKIKQTPGTAYFGIPYNDHDQLHTLTIGDDYTFKNKVQIGLNYSYGSGFASSILPGQTNRHPHDQLDLSASAPLTLNREKCNFSISVLNVLDKQNELNFLSGFDGTRFQQGRRLSITLSGRF